MEIKTTERGFPYLVQQKEGYEPLRVQASSMIDDSEEGLNNPGSSYLWVGDAHLNREEVEELAQHLQKWVETGAF